MDKESKVQSFIVKLMLEDADDETGMMVWHGYITHVPGGERRYLKSLSDITDFIEATLKETGVDLGPSRIRRWLRRLRLG